MGEPWARQPSVTEVPPEEQRPKAPARCAPRGCGVQPFLEEEAKGHIAESDGFFSSVLFPSESLALFLTYSSMVCAAADFHGMKTPRVPHPLSC